MELSGDPLSDSAISLSEYLEFACRIAESAGEAILPRFRSGQAAGDPRLHRTALEMLAAAND